MPKKVGKYEFYGTLGEGAFGKVKYAVNTETNEAVAIKILDKNKVQSRNMGTQIKKEISIMKMINHHYVVRVKDVFATSAKIFIVLEFVGGGELFDKIATEGKLPEVKARFYFKQLVEGLEYCHAKGVCHRDLKPENLLLDTDGNLKISDFGFSTLNIGDADAEGNQRIELLHTTCGTPNYVAPEVLGKKGYDGKTADVWSCGVVLYVLLAGRLPFDENTMAALFSKIKNADFEYPDYFSTEVRDLLSHILIADSALRFNITQVKAHCWVQLPADATVRRAVSAVGEQPIVYTDSGGSGKVGGLVRVAGGGGGGAAIAIANASINGVTTRSMEEIISRSNSYISIGGATRGGGGGGGGAMERSNSCSSFTRLSRDNSTDPVVIDMELQLMLGDDSTATNSECGSSINSANVSFTGSTMSTRSSNDSPAAAADYGIGIGIGYGCAYRGGGGGGNNSNGNRDAAAEALRKNSSQYSKNDGNVSSKCNSSNNSSSNVTGTSTATTYTPNSNSTDFNRYDKYSVVGQEKEEVVVHETKEGGDVGVEKVTITNQEVVVEEEECQETSSSCVGAGASASAGIPVQPTTSNNNNNNNNNNISPKTTRHQLSSHPPTAVVVVGGEGGGCCLFCGRRGTAGSVKKYKQYDEI